MGHAFSKELEEGRLKEMCDHVFYRVADTDASGRLDASELYVAVLLLYNELNKKLPGPHNDPPSRAEVLDMMRKFDFDRDGHIDREEFTEFAKAFTNKVAIRVSTKLLIALVAAPALAFGTKEVLKEVPGVNEVLTKVPNSIYTTAFTALLTLAAKPKLEA